MSSSNNNNGKLRVPFIDWNNVKDVTSWTQMAAPTNEKVFPTARSMTIRRPERYGDVLIEYARTRALSDAATTVGLKAGY